MLSKRVHTQKVQKQAKLICGLRSQDSDYFKRGRLDDGIDSMSLTSGAFYSYFLIKMVVT